MQDAAHVSIVLCSSTGNLALWPNFTQSDDVATQRISGSVVALAASTHPGKNIFLLSCTMIEERFLCSA